MRSIKEKAEEHGKNWYQRNGLFLIDDRCRGCYAHILLSYEAGANYVLKEIENVIKSDRILGHPFPSLEIRYDQIISVIEQLKK